MRAILSTTDGQVKLVDVSNYKDYYKHIDCQCFTVVTVKWAGEVVTLFVDDEGMLKPNNIGRAVRGYPEPLFGNILILGGTTRSGNTKALSEKITLELASTAISGPRYITQ